MLDASALRDTKGFIRTFGVGISKRQLGLEPLSPVTRQKKLEEGRQKPATPLYGRGESDDKSYLNMHRIIQLKNGYRVRIRSAKHWSGKLTLKQLFIIHEFGTTITFESGKTIRIPPRPAHNRAYNKYLRKKARLDPASEVRDAVRKFIREGKAELSAKILERQIMQGAI
jgi:hypothetical protein